MVASTRFLLNKLINFVMKKLYYLLLIFTSTFSFSQQEINTQWKAPNCAKSPYPILVKMITDMMRMANRLMIKAEMK